MLIPADQFHVKVRWCSARPLLAGRAYILRYKNNQLPMTVTSIKYREHEVTGEHLSARNINIHEIAVVNISTSKVIEFDERDGECEFLDVDTKQYLGQGYIEFVLHRATNIRWQQLTLDKNARAQLKKQKALCIWFTGLSGSGKSTIANLLEKHLFDQKLHTYLLDGDNLRHGLNRDLGFTEADRVENIRRVAEVSRLMVDAGLIVLASFISPYRTEREMARRLFADGEFIEIFIDAPLAECELRDVKGLYAKARRGELKNFTGIDSAYEAPEHAELVLDSYRYSPEQCVGQVMDYLRAVDLVQ
jgi:bifunctional enzyme CysN/CysC